MQCISSAIYLIFSPILLAIHVSNSIFFSKFITLRLVSWLPARCCHPGNRKYYIEKRTKAAHFLCDLSRWKTSDMRLNSTRLVILRKLVKLGYSHWFGRKLCNHEKLLRCYYSTESGRKLFSSVYMCLAFNWRIQGKNCLPQKALIFFQLFLNQKSSLCTLTRCIKDTITYFRLYMLQRGDIKISEIYAPNRVRNKLLLYKYFQLI